MGEAKPPPGSDFFFITDDDDAAAAGSFADSSFTQATPVDPSFAQPIVAPAQPPQVQPADEFVMPPVAEPVVNDVKVENVVKESTALITPSPAVTEHNDATLPAGGDTDYLIVYATDSFPDAAAAELPLEQDGTLSLLTLNIEFPGAAGIKYKNPRSNLYRIVRSVGGIIRPPPGGWADHKYVAVTQRGGAGGGPNPGIASILAESERFLNKTGAPANDDQQAAFGQQSNAPIGEPLAQQPLSADNGAASHTSRTFPPQRPLLGSNYTADDSNGGGGFSFADDSPGPSVGQSRPPMPPPAASNDGGFFFEQQGQGPPRQRMAGDEGAIYMPRRSHPSMYDMMGGPPQGGYGGTPGQSWEQPYMPEYRVPRGRPSMAMLASVGGLNAMHSASMREQHYGAPVHAGYGGGMAAMGYGSRGRGGGYGDRGRGGPRGGLGFRGRGGAPPGRGAPRGGGGGGRGGHQPPAGDFHCAVCDVLTNSQEMLDNHLKGRKHELVLEGKMKPGEKRGPPGSNTADRRDDPSVNSMPVGIRKRDERRSSEARKPLDSSFVSADEGRGSMMSTASSIGAAGIGPNSQTDFRKPDRERSQRR